MLFGTIVYLLSHSITGMLLHPSIVLGDLGPIQTQINDLVNGIKGILTGLGVTVAIIGITVGGLMRATAFGNERKVAISNQAIACAIVGLAIVLIAQTAVTALQSIFH